jgi:hypothetical protein
MKRTIIAASLAALISTGALAQGSYFDKYDPAPVVDQKLLDNVDKANDALETLDRASGQPDPWIDLLERLAKISVPQHGGTANVLHHCDKGVCVTQVLALVNNTPVGASQTRNRQGKETRVVCRFSGDYSIKMCTDFDTGAQNVFKTVDGHWTLAIGGPK